MQREERSYFGRDEFDHFVQETEFADLLMKSSSARVDAHFEQFQGSQRFVLLRRLDLVRDQTNGLQMTFGLGVHSRTEEILKVRIGTLMDWTRRFD